MSSVYNESVHFVGPAEQINLVPAHLDIEICMGEKWLHVPYDTCYNVGRIEEVYESTFRISLFVQLDGSPLDYYFECLSGSFPSLLMIGSSYCPYMGDLEFEAWFGGKPKLSNSMLLAGYKRANMPRDSNLEVPILTELRKSMNDVLAAAEVSFASGRKTPRKALRILEQMKALGFQEAV